MTGIYKIKNMINGRTYIGSAINFSRRMSSHVSLLNMNKHHSTYLQNSWNKHGEYISQYTLDGIFVRDWASGKEVQNEIGLNQGNINKVCLGKYKQAYGFVWKFKN